MTLGTDAGACYPGACDLVAQDCGAGKACLYLDTDAGTVRGCAVAGAGRENDECGAITCGAGLECLSKAPGRPLLCERYCETDADCDPNKKCTFTIAFPDTSREVARLCDTYFPPTCSVLNPICAPGRACATTGPSGDYCFVPGGKPVGALCTSPYDCVEGASCITLNRGGVRTRECIYTCDLADGSPACPSGVCTQVGLPFGLCV